MKLNPIYLYITIAVLLAIIFFKGCDKEKDVQIIEVEVPAVSGKFDPEKPKHEDAMDPVEVKWKNRFIKVANPVNDSLASAYRELKEKYTSDSLELERYKMYLEAIQIRQFSQTFEDDYLTANISGEVQGDVRSVGFDYTIKPRKIKAEVPIKETVFRLLVGAEIGNNTELSDFNYKLNIGLQNVNGDIFRGGYARQFSTDYIWVGYDHSLFRIRK
ncbi:MAG TPA: hypothetical protein VFM70_02730 [Salinimicrobium sp.]|nr:hypothetical protein [Salinimicrobium sp.]